MSVELRPLGVACNIQCQYCYQNPQRDAGNVPRSYDVEAMKAAVEREGGSFTLFGGEALLVPEDDLEALWAWGLERYGSNGVQTNGVLINNAHVRMFRKYKVQVGISLDGPGDLNDARWAGTLARTREATAKTEAAIERLCRVGMPPSLIVTLHRGNATADKLTTMHDWMRRLEAMGVTSVRLHVLEVDADDVSAAYALSTEENLVAFSSFVRLEAELNTLRLDLFDDMRNLLMGTDDQTTCVWNACDPYTTRAVRGVEGHGQSSNCGRTNKEGIDFVKASTEGFERYLALYHTPQEHGGCAGCRFFLMCKGQCPGTAIDGDWRNRTEHCDLWKGLFRQLEEQLLDGEQVPLSVSPGRRDIESAFLEMWAAGNSTSIAGVRRWMAEREQTRPPGRLQTVSSTVTSHIATSPSAMAEPLPEMSLVETGRPTAPAMERLDFTLPDFTRFMWVSDEAKDVWQARLERVTNAWLEIEWRAVLAGVRSCAVTMASPEDLITQAPQWAEEGLSALAIEMVGITGQRYSATSPQVEPGEPFVFRLVIGRPSDVAGFKRAWDAADQEAIGDLLGYPPCCREFFRRVKVDDAMVDTTWPMATATAAPVDDAATVEVDGPAQANILWHRMGARAVPHLPCRFDCPATVELADRFVAVGRACAFPQEMDWLLEVLSWPVEWSALHGIAEIKTPVLKVSTRTDATARRYVVRRRGDNYPAEGAQGLSFPFQAPVKLRLTGTRGFQQGIEHAVAVSAPRPRWYSADNGFDSLAAMDDAHRSIVAAAAAALAGRAGNVVDLGCGNGALLDKITVAARDVVPFGIDLDPIRIEHARSLQRGAAANFIIGDLFDDDELWSGGRRFALAILMPGRLLEAGPERAAVLRARLRTRCDQLLVYAYGDWLARAGGLTALARQAGLELPDQYADPRVALTTLVDKIPEEVRHES